MPQTETYISFKEYLESQPGSVVLFVLCDYRGDEVTRQIVPYEKLEMRKVGEYTAKFTVDELLSAKMHPGNYKLFIYIGLPDNDKYNALQVDERAEPLVPEDYTLNKCLTEQGVNIRVRGGTNQPTIGVGSDE